MQSKTEALARALFRRGIPAQRLLTGAPMRAFTSFRIGGPADLLLQTADGDEAAFAVAVPGAVTVDAMLNGRVAARSLPVSDGRCDFCARPFAADSGDGERALVAVIAYRADGSVAARDYVTLRTEVPPGFGVLLR